MVKVVLKYKVYINPYRKKEQYITWYVIHNGKMFSMGEAELLKLVKLENKIKLNDSEWIEIYRVLKKDIVLLKVEKLGKGQIIHTRYKYPFLGIIFD